MNTLTLKAENANEEKVLAYLTANASDTLAAKINAGTKTLSAALTYCNGLARKEAVKGVACIDDAVVFGWCIHFFEEEDATKTDATATGADDADTGDDEEGAKADEATSMPPHPAPVVPKIKTPPAVKPPKPAKAKHVSKLGASPALMASFNAQFGGGSAQ